MLEEHCSVILGVVYMARIIKYIYVISSVYFDPLSITLEESKIMDERNVPISDTKMRETEFNSVSLLL